MHLNNIGVYLDLEELASGLDGGLFLRMSRLDLRVVTNLRALHTRAPLFGLGAPGLAGSFSETGCSFLAPVHSKVKKTPLGS